MFPRCARDKWVPDSRVTACHVCNATFGLMRSKHHCRCCGCVACSNCLVDKLYKYGIHDKTCKECVVKHRSDRDGSSPAAPSVSGPPSFTNDWIDVQQQPCAVEAKHEVQAVPCVSEVAQSPTLSLVPTTIVEEPSLLPITSADVPSEASQGFEEEAPQEHVLPPPTLVDPSPPPPPSAEVREQETQQTLVEVQQCSAAPHPNAEQYATEVEGATSAVDAAVAVTARDCEPQRCANDPAPLLAPPQEMPPAQFVPSPVTSSPAAQSPYFQHPHAYPPPPPQFAPHHGYYPPLQPPQLFSTSEYPPPLMAPYLNVGYPTQHAYPQQAYPQQLGYQQQYDMQFYAPPHNMQQYPPQTTQMPGVPSSGLYPAQSFGSFPPHNVTTQYPQSNLYMSGLPQQPPQQLPAPQIQTQPQPPSQTYDAEDPIQRIMSEMEMKASYAPAVRNLIPHDIALVIDDSGSMAMQADFDNPLATRWFEVRQSVEMILRVVQAMGKTVDVYFLNRGVFRDVGCFSDIAAQFAQKPRGMTNTIAALSQLWRDRHARGVEHVPLVVHIFTDGHPTNDQGVEDMPSFAAWLRHRQHLHSTFIAILLCTNEEEVCASYRALEYRVRGRYGWNSATRGIEGVDVTEDFRNEKQAVLACRGPRYPFSFGDYVVKCLVGAIDPQVHAIDLPLGMSIY